MNGNKLKSEDKNISVERETLLINKTIKKMLSKSCSLNIMILSNEQLKDDVNIHNYVLLEINKISTLETLLMRGIKIDDLNLLKSIENNKVKCLLYTTEDINMFDEYVYFYLLQLGIFCNDFYFHNNRLICIYSDVKDNREKNIIYLIFNYGKGDFFIILPILYNLKKNKNYKFIVTDIKIYNVLMKLGFHDQIEYLSLSFFLHVLLNEKYKPFKNIINGLEYNDNKECSCFESVCEFYIRNDMVKDLSCKIIFENFKKVFPYKWIKTNQTNYKVAVQRISSSKDLDGNYIKEWPEEEMKKIINYCNFNSIEIINVCPHDDMKNEYPCDQSDRNLISVFEMLCEIDLFIGIDSCFGHMCALTGTPNINIYRRSSYQYMPLSMCYTFLHQKNEYPQAEKIIEKMIDILSHKIELSEVFLTLKERRDKAHYEFI